MDKMTFQRAAGLSAALTDRWYGPVSAAMAEFDINTPPRQAAFIAGATRGLSSRSTTALTR
jgi:putative chitinase